MASDNQSAKKRFKKVQKQSSLSRKVKVTEEEKAKQEAKKAEAKKMKAEEKKNAEIAAKIAQATTRISSQKQQSSGNPQQSTELHLEGDNIQTLSLPAFREQQSLTASDAAVTSSKKQAAMKRKQKNSKMQESTFTIPNTSGLWTSSPRG